MARNRPDDYDDREYDDDRPVRQTSGGGGSAVKIVAIIAGVVVILFLGCAGIIGGCFYWAHRTATKSMENMFSQMDKMQEDQKQRQAAAANSDKSLSKQAAEKFLTEVKARRYEPAYQLTSQSYRKGTTKKEFQDYVTKHYEALTATSPMQEDFFAPDSGTTYVVTKKGRDAGAFVDVKLTMIKEGGGWKVDQINVGKD
jgi:hypothetical protein